MQEEKARLESKTGISFWKKWGPYLTDRQWGTVREDYSPDGAAWDYISHDAAYSLAFRWGEEGIGGICDDHQLLCFAPAFWNGNDPILKERLFGLSGNEGNHGEDVKEYYYYLDSSPTHSYMKMLYKYPQNEFPYSKLVEENRRRGKNDPEFELIDTGTFDDDRYFDIFIEYAKADPDDILIRITVHNRGDSAAPVHVIPQLWFRNTWSWQPNQPKPELKLSGRNSIRINQERFENHHLYFQDQAKALFCDNETNGKRLYGQKNISGWFKDGINDHVVHNKKTVNPEKRGSKAGLDYNLSIPPQGSKTVKLRLCNRALGNPFQAFDELFKKRIQETDEFYAAIQSEIKDDDARNVQRQAFAGMLWTKQFYYYDVTQWLNGDPGHPKPPQERKRGRNHDWIHLNNADIISMPDKWEYPWYAAWDLAFHCLPLAMIDPHFAKEQLVLFTREWYMHPNGQLPAYEWAFGDVNPPVHAWATWRVFQIDRKQNKGVGDLFFLERVFQKLLLNFTWWVNRKDEHGHNIFRGGFLGLDNIGVFDRSRELPTGGHIEQADATSWMAMYCLNMLRIALELALHNPVYQDLATKFFEHFLYIAGAMQNIGDAGIELWDETDEFYYDVLHLPSDKLIPLKIHSIVGLIPLFAVETIEPDMLDKLPHFRRRLEWFLDYRSDLAALISRWHEPGLGERHLLSLLRGHRMKRIFKRMLDETEFLSDYGVRSLSKFHQDHPYRFKVDHTEFKVTYQPAESDSRLFGGNSNWRGPIWFPINYLIIESLQKFYHYYGKDFKIEHPTGSGHFVTIAQAANELSLRLTRIFLKDKDGKRPVFGNHEKFQSDPHFRDYLLFYEYFHGDNGRGVGASHQTGWT